MKRSSATVHCTAGEDCVCGIIDIQIMELTNHAPTPLLDRGHLHGQSTWNFRRLNTTANWFSRNGHTFSALHFREMHLNLIGFKTGIVFHGWLLLSQHWLIWKQQRR